MANSTSKLSALQVKNASFQGKPQKLFDGGGLYLHVQESGKYWRLKYRYGNKERLLSLGVYPAVSLASARVARDDAKQLLAEGIDPRDRKQSLKEHKANTFESVATEWIELQKPKLAKSSYQKSLWLLQKLYPQIGHRPIADLTPPDLLSAIRRIESEGIHESAHRAKQKAGQVFRYAIATGRAERDPTSDLRGALAPVTTRNHPAITNPNEIAMLLHAIDGYSGHFTVAKALQLAPLLFVRPGELRAMEWKELDLASTEWRIPPEKTKMRTQHIVPLAMQAVTILEDLFPLTGRGRYVFPSVRSASRPMSDNTLNAALRRLGYTKDEMTAHGFRAMASTRMNEMGWNPDIIERQLAHVERNKVRAAYNRAQHLDERKRLMQDWADYLDGLRTTKNVVAFTSRR